MRRVSPLLSILNSTHRFSSERPHSTEQFSDGLSFYDGSNMGGFSPGTCKNATCFCNPATFLVLSRYKRNTDTLKCELKRVGAPAFEFTLQCVCIVSLPEPQTKGRVGLKRARNVSVDVSD